MSRLRERFGTRRVAPEERLSVVEHLDELRRRVFIAALALVVAFGAMYAVHDQLLDLLAWPLPEDRRTLVTLSPVEPFFTVLKVSFWASIIVALPVWLYQLYAFVIPAVGPQPRRKMLAVVAGVSALFAAGVAFGFFLVLPVALDFLLGFGEGLFTTELRAGDYYAFVTTMLLGAGLVFEVPVAMVALARIGVITASAYRRNWRTAIVVIALIAAILPGGDPFSMILLMIPMIVLYQVGIWLSAVFGGPPVWERGLWDSGADAEAAQGSDPSS